MSIDDLARAASAEARKVARDVDVVTRLQELHRTRRRRNLVSTVAAVLVGTVALVGGGFLLARNPHDPTGSGVTPPASSGKPSGDNPCSDPAISCLGANRFRVALRVPVTVTLPDSFQGAFSLLGRGVLEDYRTDVGTTGVTILEDATPVKDDATWSRDPAAGKTAQSAATWLVNRPFFVHATITQTTVGGRTAWRVSADLKPGAPLPAYKSGSAVGPTFVAGPATAAVGAHLVGEYTLLDVPGAGVTVIWSWSQNHGTQLLSGNRVYVEGLSFGE